MTLTSSRIFDLLESLLAYLLLSLVIVSLESHEQIILLYSLPQSDVTFKSKLYRTLIHIHRLQISKRLFPLGQNSGRQLKPRECA